MTAKPTCCETHPKNRFDYLFWLPLIAVTGLFALGIMAPAWLADLSWLQTMAHTAHQMVSAMWWGVVIGFIFVGILSKVPREFILAILGPGGSLSGLGRAVGAGVLLDLCSHGILMVAAKLYERGASAGQIIAFLLASPWNSFSLTLILIGLIGLQWTLLFILLSMAIALATGWVFERLVATKILPANPNTAIKNADFVFWRDARAGLQQTNFNLSFFRSMLSAGIKDSKMVVRWLLIGILLAAVLRALLSPDQFEQFLGPTLLGLILTIFISTVLEVCSEGSTPIAADIINRAHAPGNGFAFLMTGVATDYTEIMVLKDTTKSWRLALFLPLISVPQIIIIAWLINIYG